MNNSQIAYELEALALLTQLDDPNPWKAAAFKRVADEVRLQREELTLEQAVALPGVGASTHAVLHELYTLGKSSRIETLRSRWPDDALSMTRVHGIGPVRAMKLRETRGFRHYGDLLAAAKAGTLGDEALTKAVLASETMCRVPREKASAIAAWVRQCLVASGTVSQIEVCGSVRRRSLSSKDIDVVAVAREESTREAAFDAVEALGDAVNRGAAKSTVRITRWCTTMHVDLWIVSAHEFGAAVAYATGSKEHNVSMRSRAKAMGLLLNEKGVWDGERRIAGETERSIYGALGVEYVAPENR